MQAQPFRVSCLPRLTLLIYRWHLGKLCRPWVSMVRFDHSIGCNKTHLWLQVDYLTRVHANISKNIDRWDCYKRVSNTLVWVNYKCFSVQKNRLFEAKKIWRIYFELKKNIDVQTFYKRNQLKFGLIECN